MRSRRWCCGLWLVLACCLYFFENDTGTRTVLACTLLLPLLPAVRRALFSPDEKRESLPRFERSAPDRTRQETDEPGNVRDYRPGDPVNRIHWKLSAKRGALLLRERPMEWTGEEAKKERPVPDRPRSRRKTALWALLAVFLLSLSLLWAVPSLRLGALALANRLFEASEAANAYVYDRFPVPAEQPSGPALLLLTLALAALSGMTALSRSRAAALLPASGCVLFQVYFGLSFPAPAHAALFALFTLSQLRRPPEGKAVLRALAGIAAVFLLISLAWPGQDPAAEAASEAVRDALSRAAGQEAGAAAELPPGESETRRAHTLDLAEGTREARAGKEYRLVTVEEEKISMPHWVDYLRIAALLLLAAAVVVLPFLPFALAEARRKKALAMRKAFRSGDVSEAVCAIFQQVISWLEATGNGAGNRPYASWGECLEEKAFSGEYVSLFGQCAALFEEAAYSGHVLGEEQRHKALALLEETERTLRAGAGWKDRLRLKYKECLWI